MAVHARDGVADDGVGQRRRVRDRGDGRRQHPRIRGRPQRDREAFRHARQHLRRSGRPHRRHVVRGRPEGRARTTSRSRPATRSPCPRSREWADTRTYDFTDPTGVHHELDNHDKFLPDNGFGYAGANGFKTGYTEVADHTLVATAKRNGRQCIAVILGSSDSGYTWAASLLDQCWQKPAVATTGSVLPPVAVSPYATRAGRHAPRFTELAAGSTGAALDAKTATARRPRHHGTRRPPRHGRPRRAVDHDAPRTTDGRSITARRPARRRPHADRGRVPAHRSRWPSCLRRRAVKRQRARRIARQRARAKAMRSGSLPGRRRSLPHRHTRRPAARVARCASSATTSTSPSCERAELEGRSPSDDGIA